MAFAASAGGEPAVFVAASYGGLAAVLIRARLAGPARWAAAAVAPVISTDKFQFYQHKNPIDRGISKRVFYRRTNTN
ncbi:hypothetical protein KAM385_33310 [Aeromonas hydrophila]|nr:hypothetical protein KAM385_33310 [Aeromonas hydrophila]